MSVAELLRTHSSAELTEWMGYENVTGTLGPERLDALFSILTATVSNTARAKGAKATPRDFMPAWDQNAPADWRQMLTTARTITARHSHDSPGGAHAGDNA